MSSADLETNKIFANAFNLIPELGPVKLAKLFQHFPNWQQAWEAGLTDYQQAGIDQKTIDQIIAKKTWINPAQQYHKLEQNQIQVILITDAIYPAQLKEIPACPPILYVRGNPKLLGNLSIGVVGTRKMSVYGKQATAHLVESLVQHNICIVSGLAFGVDAQALSTALNCGGSVIAVLASSIDNASISPRINFNLAQKILETGCIVSEHALGSSVQKQNFPIRNRIISGLSAGTLIIEADEESGALITANYALEQNREVFAVPGSIFNPVSRGTNNLIKKGAKLVTSAHDIIEELNLDIQPDKAMNQPVTEKEQFLLEHLTRQPVFIDELIKQCKLNASETNSLLTILEMKGRVKNLGGAKYVKIR